MLCVTHISKNYLIVTRESATKDLHLMSLIAYRFLYAFRFYCQMDYNDRSNSEFVDSMNDVAENKTVSGLYDSYYYAHSYIAVCLGPLAILTNIFIMVVLTRRSMLSTVNTILTAVAFCDSMVLIMYVTYVFAWRLIPTPCRLGRPIYWSWALFEVIFADMTITLRGLSLWLTVAMAALRYQVIISRDPSGKRTSDRRISYQLIAICTVSVLAMGIPIYLTNTIAKTKSIEWGGDCEEEFLYFAELTNLSLANDKLLYKISFWSNGILFRLLPCVFLTFYIPALIIVANRKSPMLANAVRRQGKRNHTTFVLAAITLTSWLCETPHSIMSIICGFQPEYEDLYKNFGDIFDLLSLINSFLTFVLYCGMSQRFRETFVQCAKDVFSCCHSKEVPPTLV